jgi:hypothetical protein
MVNFRDFQALESDLNWMLGAFTNGHAETWFMPFNGSLAQVPLCSNTTKPTRKS